MKFHAKAGEGRCLAAEDLQQHLGTARWVALPGRHRLQTAVEGAGIEIRQVAEELIGGEGLDPKGREHLTGEVAHVEGGDHFGLGCNGSRQHMPITWIAAQLIGQASGLLHHRLGESPIHRGTEPVGLLR